MLISLKDLILLFAHTYERIFHDTTESQGKRKAGDCAQRIFAYRVSHIDHLSPRRKSVGILISDSERSPRLLRILRQTFCTFTQYLRGFRSEDSSLRARASECVTVGPEIRFLGHCRPPPPPFPPISAEVSVLLQDENPWTLRLALLRSDVERRNTSVVIDGIPGSDRS